jgi:hemolysin-activating ACP:hemolysin acyltransferase
MWGKRRETKADKCAEIAAAIAPLSEVQAQPDADSSLPRGETSELNLSGRSSFSSEVSADGAAAQRAPAMDEKTQAFWRGKLATANFGGAVSLFMRSPAHRHYTLADLEWCLLPALALNQFMVAEAKLPNGQAVPVALVLWARVSAEIDARLSAAPRYPIRLHPNEWQSGEVIWIVDAVGDPTAMQNCIETLTKTAFQGKQVRMLSQKSTNQ